MKTVEDVWNECERRQVRIVQQAEFEAVDLTEFEQAKIIAYREIQFFIAGVASRYPRQVGEI